VNEHENRFWRENVNKAVQEWTRARRKAVMTSIKAFELYQDPSKGGKTHHAEGRVDPDDLAKKIRN
jgi:hypothetical protein